MPSTSGERFHSLSVHNGDPDCSSTRPSATLWNQRSSSRSGATATVKPSISGSGELRRDAHSKAEASPHCAKH